MKSFLSASSCLLLAAGAAGPCVSGPNEPEMSVFPVAGPHNIGYDQSCISGPCETTCPDQNANSDRGFRQDGTYHHGIDIFATHRAPLVAVTAGTIEEVGWVVGSKISGIRVRLRDKGGWEYYYGHLDESVVAKGDYVQPGQLIGYMGKTGAGSDHLHFNVSLNGDFENDIDPLYLLVATSPSACNGCTAQSTSDCAAFGCRCVDSVCSGGACVGNGCTAQRTSDCSAVNCGCVDMQCAGGACEGSGCTEKAEQDCAASGCGCQNMVCSGGSCP